METSSKRGDDKIGNVSVDSVCCSAVEFHHMYSMAIDPNLNRGSYSE